MKRLLVLFLSFICMILPGCSAGQSNRRRKAENLDRLFHYILRQRTRRVQRIG